MAHATLRFAALAFLTVHLLFGGTARAAGVPDPLDRPALALRTPGKGSLLAVEATGRNKPRLVAAGERGIIVLSDNGGISWRQAKVPVSVTITALAFPTPELGWAVGHGGVVLHTADGGETWFKQLDGNEAARVADLAAQTSGDITLQQRTAQLVADGPDKPFMAVHFADDRHGFIVGAYGLIFGTEDGGRTWKSWLDRVDNPKGLHINAIAVAGETRYLAGEQGLLLRSDDAGQHFIRLSSPYPGSFFTATTSDRTLLVAGLKGNAFRSNNRGATFNKLIEAPPINIVASRRLAANRLLLVNQSGQLLVANDEGALGWVPLPPGPPALAALPLADGTWIVAGPRGVSRATPTP
jgi:photosystem II stability/assembly factor-like uncharacterized protein